MALKIIGIIGIASCVVWFLVFWKKKPGKGMSVGVLAALAVFIIAVVLPPADNTKNQAAVSSTAGSSSSTGSSAVSNAVTAAKKPYHAELIGGYYTPGIDFPAGLYRVTVLAGDGQIYYTTPSGGGKTVLLSISGTKEIPSIDLPLGEALSVTGLKIKLDSSAADSAQLSERENSATKTVTLSPGTYQVGKHIEDGIYDVISVTGKVKIDSDSQGVVCHETLNSQGKDYEKEFRNLTLDEGTTLTVTGGTAKLVPSK